MTARPWSDLLTERDERVISAAGYDEGSAAWDSRGTGDSPLVLVVDMQAAIVGDDVPILEAIENSDYKGVMGSVAWDALSEIEPFLARVRELDVPVMYTKVVPAGYDSPDHPDLRIADPISPQDGEEVVPKSYASAVYGTDLTTRLIRRGIDTLVVVGSTNNARAWNIYSEKGSIRVGTDADLVVVDLDETRTVTPELLGGAADYSVYDGREVTGWPSHTVVRGRVCYAEGRVEAEPGHGEHIERPV
jgi:hypothetical protein